jgi:hypothetical protein
MLLKVFRGTGPGVVFLIFLAAIAVWASALFEPRLAVSFHYDNNPMPLYALLKSLAGKSAFVGTMISFVLVMLMAVLLVSFNTTVFFINERTFLPALIFVLFSGLFPYYQVLNPVLPAAVLLMIAIMRIMEAYRKNGTAFNFFDAGFLIGTGSLFYANLIWFGLLTIIGIAILRTGNFKEIILALLGLCTPVIITAGIYYVAGKDLQDLLSVTLNNLFGDAGSYYFSRATITGLIIIGLSVLVSLFYLISVVNNKKIKSRKTFTELIWTFIICLAVFFSLPSASVELIFILTIPVSYFLSHYFVFSRNKIMPEFFFSVMFLIVAAIQVLFIKS